MESRWSLRSAVTPFTVMHLITQTRLHGYCMSLALGGRSVKGHML
jgi:hypothetical protein